MMIIAVVCMVVAAVAIILFLIQPSKCSTNDGNSSTSSSVSTSAKPNETKSESTGYSTTATAENDDSNDKSEKSEEIASSIQITAEGAKSSSSIINLSNKDEYGMVNLFISNFAELPNFWLDYDYDCSSPDAEKIIDWGFWHYGMNNDVLQRGSIDVAGAGTYNWNLDTDGLEQSINKYLGLKYDLSNYRAGNFAEQDGRFYRKGSDDESQDCNYIALSQFASDLANDEVEIEFTVVSTWTPHQMVSDTSWYSMSINELITAMGRDYSADDIRTATGKAALRISGSGDSRTFVLEKLEMDRDSAGNIAWSISS